MVDLRYIGRAPDRRPWLGPVTGIVYPFAPGESRWVDCRDATIWLRPPKGNGRAFEEVQGDSEEVQEDLEGVAE